MAFKAEVGQEIAVGDQVYCIAEHPGVPGNPYGQEGRAAVVYQVLDQLDARWALKVFKPQYRLPYLVEESKRILPFADLPGLRVCRRTVLSATQHRLLLRQYPDLAYSVLMPWVAGPTWLQILVTRQQLLPQMSLSLASSLTLVLTTLEERGLAHCDLSGANILLPGMEADSCESTASAVELVDVEQLFGPGLIRPEILMSGSAGYGHPAVGGAWGKDADRFSGAVLIAEILGWCDSEVVAAAWGESYFDPEELQHSSDRYAVLLRALKARWGQALGELLERVWQAETLSACPTLGEWLAVMPDRVTEPEPEHDPETAEPVEGISADARVEETLRSFATLAQALEAKGDRVGALLVYRQALALTQPQSELAEELQQIVSELQRQVAEPGGDAASPTLTPDQGRVASPGAWVEAERAEPLAGLSLAGHAKPDIQPRPEVSIPSWEDLAGLYDAGYAAYSSRQWEQAEELLTAVVSQEPNYVRDDQKASDLLAMTRARRRVNERTAGAGRRRANGRRALWAAGGLTFVLAIALYLLWPRLMPATPGIGTAEAGTESPIRIALLAPLSGDMSSIGQTMLDSASLAVDAWNQSGGALGRRVELVTRDTQCSPEIAAAAATEVIEQEAVELIIGDACSSSSIAIAEVAAAKGALQIAPGATNPLVTVDEAGNTRPTVFRACFADPFQGTAGAKYALETLGARTAVVFLDPGDDYVRGLAEHFRAAFEAGGGRVLAWETYTSTDLKFRAVLAKTKGSDPDILYLPGYCPTVNLIARQARAEGVTTTVMGGDGWDSAGLDLQALQGAYYTYHYSPDDQRARNLEFVQTFRTVWGHPPDAVAALSYDSVDMLLQAITRSSSTNPAVVAQTLEGMQLDLVTGALQFDAQHNPNKSVAMLQVDGQTVRYAGSVEGVTEEQMASPKGPVTTDVGVSPAAALMLGGSAGDSLRVILEDGFTELSPDIWSLSPQQAGADAEVGVLRLEGEPQSTSTLQHTYPISDGHAILILFQYQPDSAFDTYLRTGYRNESEYLRWGVSVVPEPHMSLQDGIAGQSTPEFSGDLQMLPGHWYSLVFGIGCTGRFTAAIWDSQSLESGLWYQQQFTDRWQRKAWTFTLDALQGTVLVDSFVVFSFADCSGIRPLDLSASLADACVPQPYSEVTPARYVYIDDREDPEPTPGYSSYDYEAVYVSETGVSGPDDVRVSPLGANSDPVWSPDGSTFAYIHAPEDNRNYVTLVEWPAGISKDIRGSYIAGRLSGLSWSADGTQLALESWGPSPGAYGLAVLDTETARVALVLPNESQGYPRYEHIYWSPCGDRIAFQVRDGSDNNEADGWLVRLVNVDGQGEVTVTDVDDGIGTYGPFLWSVDGKWLTFQAFTVDEEGNRGPVETWVVSAEGGRPHRLEEPLLVVDQTRYPWTRLLTP